MKIHFIYFIRDFLSKYFPYVTYLHLKKFLESGKLNEEKKLITQDLMNEQYYLELIKYKKEDINIKLKHTSLISTNIHVNYYMPPPNFIEMRDLFDFFVLDENIPYVKFRNSIENSVDTKILEDIYVFDNKTFVDWTDNMHLMESVLELKKSLNPKSDSYKKYSIVNIFPDGKIEFKVTWKEEEHANFADIDEALCSLRNLIIKINDMDSKFLKITRRYLFHRRKIQ